MSLVHSPSAHTQPDSVKTVAHLTAAERAYGEDFASLLLVKQKRRGAYRAVRDRLWSKGLRTCHYCARPLSLERDRPDSSTLDHKTPLSRGGDESPENYALACHACNQVKGDQTVAEFSAAILEALEPQQ